MYNSYYRQLYLIAPAIFLTLPMTIIQTCIALNVDANTKITVHVRSMNKVDTYKGMTKRMYICIYDFVTYNILLILCF